MSAYDLDQLILLWKREKLTTEQAIGQLLLQIQALSERVGQLEQVLARQRRGKRPSDEA